MTPFISYALAMSLMFPGGVPLSAVTAGTQANPPSTTTRGAATPQPVDGGWPRAYITTAGSRLVLYAPQVASWLDQKKIVMYAALSYTPADQSAVALGTVRIEANTKVAVPERLVSFSDFEITSANFPTLPRDQLKTVVEEIKATVPSQDRVIGLDRVLAAMDSSQVKPKNVAGLKADPPPIFFSSHPAVLVNIDGEPIWSPIKDNALRFAVNTNWDLFELGSPPTYYLRIDTRWMTASKIDGPWTEVHRALPGSFAMLSADDNWKDVRAALAASKTSTPIAAPIVFVSKAPAELIVLNGSAMYAPVKGTTLEWVSNTDSDIFRLGTNGSVYYLVSGRWFSAPAFTGPWTFATPNLPGDFKHIPLDHPRSRVLASVPGTTQALEAVLIAQVPQTARVSRTEAKAPQVEYQGEPQFDPINTTTVARAVNTDKDILKVGDLYYMCYQGVWFKSTTPTGPWEVADSVPREIYDIPISSPAYNVTYVTVEDSDDDWVDFAAAAAYTGCMIGWGVAMWGTGYYYPPYFWGGGLYPAYFGHYPSYGYGARYNPWTGAYSRGGAIYGPYGGAGYAARYNPGTGTYARGAAAWGPGGARGAAQAWNPRTGTYAQTRQGANVYGSWGGTAVQRGDQWAATARTTNRATGATDRVTTGSGGGGVASHSGALGRTSVGRTGSGDVYAGHDGNVYRNQGGSWQKYDNGGWNSVDRSAAGGQLSSSTRSQLNQDFKARADGSQRTRDFGSASSRGFGGGSYRSSGGSFGGSRGGGGFRGGGGGRRR